MVALPLLMVALLVVVGERTAVCGDAGTEPEAASGEDVEGAKDAGDDDSARSGAPGVAPTSKWDPAGCPLAMPEEHAGATQVKGDVILVMKSRYKLGFYRQGELVEVEGEDRRACFDIALGFEPVGHKLRQGDGRTPEGWYWVSWKIPKGETSFYKALYVNYPNADDAEVGLKSGLIQQAMHDRIVRSAGKRSTVTDSALGALIEIHGSGSYPKNWTLGCVALDNNNMDWLYDSSAGGKTAILIVP